MREASSTPEADGNATQPGESSTLSPDAECSPEHPGEADPKRRATPELQGFGRVLTVREVAKILRVSTATVYDLCSKGDLPHFRVSNAIRVWESDVRAFAGS